MTEERHPFQLAPAAQPAPEPAVSETAREVFPLRLEKDFLDFRPVEQPREDDALLAPKASSAPVSVTQPALVTGLEDVSNEDLETSVLPNAEKDTSPKSEKSLPTLIEQVSSGKSEPPART